jgi:hypothetical protein
MQLNVFRMAAFVSSWGNFPAPRFWDGKSPHYIGFEMKKINWLSRWAGVSMLLTGLLAGCGGNDGTSLSVELNTRPKTADDVHQGVQLLANGIRKFQVELLSQDGKPLELAHVEVAPGSQYAQVKFSVPQTGAYQIRSSAYMPDEALLGTTLESVKVQAGNNKLVIDKLGLAELYYSDKSHLQQTQSRAGLEKFLSYDQPGVSLQAYCFFGYLEGEDSNRLAYFSLIQRLNQPITKDGQTVRLPAIMAGSGIGSRNLAGFRVSGSGGLALLDNKIDLQHQPWDASVTTNNSAGSVSPQNQTRASLVSGTFGQKGARYQITSYGQDAEGKLMTTNILTEDSMGFVSEGFGVNAFLPNWLQPAQEKAIRNQFGGSVEKYLAETKDPMMGQGSYYYSAPYLKVLNFEVKYEDSGTVTAKGTGGLLWMDVVYQTFDDKAIDVIKDSTWSFFIMQLKEAGGKEKAIMTTRVGTKVSDYQVSSLFDADAKKNANGVLEPEYRWNLQDIEMKPVPGSEWKSPASKESYYTKYTVKLGGERPADLTVTMDWPEQEINVMGRFVYEGLGNVSGMLNGKPVTGTAWLEMQPVGKL